METWFSQLRISIYDVHIWRKIWTHSGRQTSIKCRFIAKCPYILLMVASQGPKFHQNYSFFPRCKPFNETNNYWLQKKKEAGQHFHVKRGGKKRHPKHLRLFSVSMVLLHSNLSLARVAGANGSQCVADLQLAQPEGKKKKEESVVQISMRWTEEKPRTLKMLSLSLTNASWKFDFARFPSHSWVWFDERQDLNFIWKLLLSPGEWKILNSQFSVGITELDILRTNSKTHVFI